MSEHWSIEEVESVVADYFDMLTSELKGETYNKREHRRRLAALLDGRSSPSIERKHQNISAVLNEAHFPWIIRYKPLGNYQRLLGLTRRVLTISASITPRAQAHEYSS